MPNKGTNNVLLNDNELALLRAYAEAEGITEDEAASRLVSEALARRVRRNTGKTPAKIYSIKKDKH